MPADVILFAPPGATPGKFLLRAAERARATEEDLRYVGNNEKSRILQRTARGVDLDGRPFAPYSTKGPYYYNPTGRNVRQIADPKADRAARRSAARRFRQKLGVGQVQGTSVRFDSYAAFKRALGRPYIDLTGPRTPHMLQALVVRIDKNQLSLGIHGETAERAIAHNEGVPSRGLPERRFFPTAGRENPDDRRAMIEDLRFRILNRLNRP